MKFSIFLVTGIIILISFSCSHKIYKNSETDEITIYPSPPDTARIQYLTSISSSADIKGKKSGFGRFLFGEDEKQNIIKPYGIAIYDGKIYLCDTQVDGIIIIDLKKGGFEYFTPTGYGQLKKPINCAVDNLGNLYVADAERKQIVVFDPEGKYIESFGEKDNFKPTDVFVKDDKVWVSNMANHKIHVYDKKTFNILSTIPDAETETGDEDNLYKPINLYVTDDRVYVCDFGDFKIKSYTHDGEFIMSVGSYGKQLGQFVRPKGIAVDKEDNLYVVDAGFENTQIFNKDGQLLMFFGGPYSKPGDMWLPAKVSIDYDNLAYFSDLVDERFNLKYLIFITNQYGPDKLSVYGYVELK